MISQSTVRTTLVVSILTLTGSLIVPAATAETGLQGSYLGIAVDGSAAHDTLPSFLRAFSQQSWILDEALRQARESNSKLNPSPNQRDVVGNQFQGRFDLPNNSLSVRGTFFVNPDASAILPSLTYDLPIGKNTNIYAGAGYAFVKSSGAATPFGNQSGVVLTTGIEAAAGRNLVIYGDTKLNLNAPKAGEGSPVRFQFGAGFRF